MTRRCGWLALALCALCVTAAGAPSTRGIRAAIDRVLSRPAFESAFWGVEVRSLKDGRVLYARNERKSMTPASVLKLVVTAAALDALGPDARLRTTLETTALLDASGGLLGDVYLVGRGDPTLAEPASDGRNAFEALADDLWNAGVRRIEGSIVGHEGLFKGDRRGDGWQWEDLVWCYGAEISALSWNDNCAALVVRPGERVGDPVLLSRQPASSYYSVVSSATTAAAGSNVELSLARPLGSNVVTLSGGLPLGAGSETLSVAIEDPARYAATVFTELLRSRGIQVAAPVVTSSDPLPPTARVLAVHESAPLAEILKGINKPSQNLRSEILLRLLGATAKGEGSASAGHAAVMDFLRRLGVEAEGWALADASGLAHTDLVTPHDVVSLLGSMDRHPYARAFRDSLAVAGVDGTLAGRLRGTPAEGRIAAKTGTLRQSHALAGYVTTRSGDRLAFAVAINHHVGPGREAVAAIDEVAAFLAGL